VILYGWYAHFHYDITQDLLVDIFSATRSTAQRLDWVGGFITLLVGLCNYESFKVSKAKEKDAHGVKQDSGTNTQNPNVNVSSTAAGSPGNNPPNCWSQ
jgi:hypothetical protein